jgi:hypothetical protein
MPRDTRPIETRENLDQQLIEEFATLVDAKGRIEAAALYELLTRTVWVDGVGDRRASRALRTAIAPAS